jgi:hypothetical protein
MTTAAPQYPFDPTGVAPTNKIVGERQTISPPDWTDFYFICPTATPYFASSLVLTLVATGRQLIEGVDYNPTHRFYDASLQCASPVYGSITFLDKTLSGVIEMNYQVLGGDWTLNSDEIATILANTLMDPRITTWEEVVDLPYQFPPVSHPWDIVDMVGASDIVTALNNMVTALLQSGDQGLATHLADFNNPHHVSAAQVGLGNVQNYPLATTADAISGSSNVLYMTPQLVQAEIGQFAIIPLNAHINNTTNPHGVTATQVGLGNVQNYGLATAPQAQAGVATNAYMTPALTAAAIMSQAIAPLNSHLANFNNPHQVSAAQVGLGNVPNYAMATVAMAQAGTDTQSFMSPALVTAVMQTGAGGNLQAHIDDHSNPHEVTATQVGLGNVQNYPIASNPQAVAGTDNATYMTPQLTAAQVAAATAPFSSHLTDTNNPHGVTATQVGLGDVQNYAMAQVADAVAGTLPTAYMSPYLTAQAITAQAVTPLNTHLADFNNPHQVTLAQLGAASASDLSTAISSLATEYLAIDAQAVDSAKLEGQTLAQVISAAATGAALTLTYPAYAGTEVQSWTTLAVMDVAAPQDTAAYPPPLFFEVTGGDGWAGNVAGGMDSSTFEISANAQDPTNIRVVRTSGYDAGPTIGYVYNSILNKVYIYLASAASRGVVVIRFFSDTTGSFSPTAAVADFEPSGIVYVVEADLSTKAMATRSNAGQMGFGPAYGSTLSSAYLEHDTLIQRVNVIDSAELDSSVNTLTQDWGIYWANGPRLASLNGEAYRSGSLLGWGWDSTNSVVKYSGTNNAMMSLLSESTVATSMTLEVLVTSDDLSDMGIGLAAAYTDTKGQPAMLHIFRDCGGLTTASQTLGALSSRGQFNLFTVGFNLFQNDGLVMLADATDLTWGDGVADASRGGTPYAPVVNNIVSTWAASTAEVQDTVVLGNGSYWAVTTEGTTDVAEPAWPATPAVGTTVTDGTVIWTFMEANGWKGKGSVAIKAVLSGTTLTVSTSDFGAVAGSITYVNTQVIDLATYSWHPGIAALTQALQSEGVRWGLATYRVPGATFSLQAAPDTYQRFAHLNEGTGGVDASVLSVYDGSAWVTSNFADQVMVKPGRIYYSASNNRMFHALRNGTLTPIQLVSYTPDGTAILTT